jgi:hypothetical protein
MLSKLWDKLYDFDRAHPMFFMIWDICIAVSVIIAIMTDSKFLSILVCLTVMNLIRNLFILIMYLKNLKNNNKKRG